jgi:hypothetical protein
MMEKENTRRKANAILVGAMFAGLLGSSIIASAGMAAGLQSANLWAVPTHSRVNDGHFQLLKLLFHLDSATQIEKIRVTLDGDATKVVEFTANGDVLLMTPPFVMVDGSTKFVDSDGYVISKALGQFNIAINKTHPLSPLSAGPHTAEVEVITSTGTLTDTAHFTLR